MFTKVNLNDYFLVQNLLNKNIYLISVETYVHINYIIQLSC